MGRNSVWRMEAQLFLQNLNIYWMALPLFKKVRVSWMWLNLNNIFARDEMSLNELKWA